MMDKPDSSAPSQWQLVALIPRSVAPAWDCTKAKMWRPLTLPPAGHATV